MMETGAETGEKVWWKKAIGTPRWWLVNGVIIALVIAAIIVIDRAEGAEPTGASTGAGQAGQVGQVGQVGQEQQRTAPQMRCPDDDPCPTNAEYLRRFQADRYSNAKGLRLPPALIRRIDNKVAARCARGGQIACRVYADDTPWYKEVLKSTACLVIGSNRAARAACSQGQEKVDDLTERATKFSLVCGSLAIVGSLGGGGTWGAAKATIACSIGSLLTDKY